MFHYVRQNGVSGTAVVTLPPRLSKEVYPSSAFRHLSSGGWVSRLLRCRDSVRESCTMAQQPFHCDFVATRKVRHKIEKFSVIKALKGLERCEVALVVMDASEGITDQDITVAGYAHERGCGCILLLNKWDLIEKDSSTVRRYHEELRMAAKFLNFAPIITISALTGQRVIKIFTLVDEVTASISTMRCNSLCSITCRT